MPSQSQSTPSQIVRVVDTHTGGEPTRVVIESPISLEGRSLFEKREDFSKRFDDFRRAIICEPRGNDVVVGAVLTEPENEGSHAGVIFFNNVGYLGMCGHGTIGVAIALQHLGHVKTGKTTLDTPVGSVTFDLGMDNKVSIENVPSYRLAKQIELRLNDGRRIKGDIAWGGNWFFICHEHGEEVTKSNVRALTELSIAIRDQLVSDGITGSDGAYIDHVELMGPPEHRDASAKNFVLCPGSAYDRSPCGTGTSAKVACLAADGKLAPGEITIQESIVGSVFEASYQLCDQGEDLSQPENAVVVTPTIVGTAYVNAEANLILDPRDPFCMGIQ